MNVANEKHILECYKCNEKFHGYCGNTGIFCTKTFLNLFVGLQNNRSFKFICPVCATQEESTNASNIKEQLAQVVTALSTLSKEVQELNDTKLQNLKPIKETVVKSSDLNTPSNTVWGDELKMKQVRRAPDEVTLCIKSKGEEIDMSKVKGVIISNRIQVKHASVKKTTGDICINLPDKEFKIS